MASPSSPSHAIHVPVLLREVLSQLDLQPGQIVVDGTVGAAGHSRQILSRIIPGGRLIGLDRDPLMLDWARPLLSGPDVQLLQSSYRELRSVLDNLHISTVDRVLLDLGLSSDQLADRERGFGFDAGGPLDMRYDISQGIPVSEWLATVSESVLAETLTANAEVHQAPALAAAVVRRRRTQPIATAADLHNVLQEVVGRRPVTRDQLAPLFQALRIVVNSELAHLKEFLQGGLPDCLASDGRVAIITFHSVEDRLVKQALRPEHGWQPLAKKPIEPTPAEVRVNPRSRSARLRVAVRATHLVART